MRDASFIRANDVVVSLLTDDLRRAPWRGAPCVLADALGGASILDVAEAERHLRDAGRIVAVITRERFRGWTTPEKAA